jgi:hypothetical protein
MSDYSNYSVDHLDELDNKILKRGAKIYYSKSGVSGVKTIQFGESHDLLLAFWFPPFFTVSLSKQHRKVNMKIFTRL